MQHPYIRLAKAPATLLLLLLLLTPYLGRAQAPSWQLAAAIDQLNGSGSAVVRATAVNAAGDVLATGSFSGTITFPGAGGQLVADGPDDIFVAKWRPATRTWAWATEGGGLGSDQGTGIAVSGTSVYVTGQFTGSTSAGLSFGFVSVSGLSATSSADAFVAKFTDNTSYATCNWLAAGGGAGDDRGTALAVSGTSVYMTGYFTNSSTNSNLVRFGGQVLNGTSPSLSTDVFLAKYTDQGTTTAYSWAVAAGGAADDQGTGIAINGTSIFLTGHVTNSSTNANLVRFGTLSLAGTSPSPSADVFVAKYTDQATTTSCSWAVAAGGLGEDQGTGIAINGTSIFLTGFFTNSSTDNNLVRFGNLSLAGISPSPSADVFVAKYTDQATTASCSWATAGGGSGEDKGTALAVSATSILLTGFFTNSSTDNNLVRFGNLSLAGTSPSPNPDVFVAKYTDQGTTTTLSWATAGGGTGSDRGTAIAVDGTNVYAGLSVGTGVATVSTFSIVANAGAVAVLSASSGTPTGLGATQTVPGNSMVRALALNAAGDVFVTGSFSREATFGPTTLTSAGGTDVFVAKWSASTQAWVWAVAGGGWDFDRGTAIAVNGANVYVTGSFNNSLSNTTRAQFGGITLPGASTDYVYGDIFLAKYTDLGTSASFNWAVAAGGTQGDYAAGIALSGSSIYLTGALSNTTTNASRVQFSGVTVNGASNTSSIDLFLAKYTDANTSPTFNWAVTGGGTRDDAGTSLAVSGTSLYLTGALTNSRTNANQARFGGQALNGASNSDLYPDMLLVKYTDTGSTASYNWGTVGGGTFVDQGNSIAVNGTSVYVTGAFSNSTTNANQVDFSGTTLNGMYTNGSFQDVFLAKYTDLGSSSSLNWVTAGGGSGDDQAYGLAVDGTSLFVSGRFSNSSTNVNQVSFGGVALNGVFATSSSDLFVAQYTDAGATARGVWAAAGGGAFDERGYAVARNAAGVYVAGQVGVPATFGSFALPGVNSQMGLLARLGGGVLPTRGAVTFPAFALYPNPGAGRATITGLPAGQTVQVFDALGRWVLTGIVPATGGLFLELAPNRPAGVYLVKANGQVRRWLVE